MKVIILNGSPKAEGNTATALHEVERILNLQDIETEWIHVGHRQIHGCIACNKCWDTNECCFHDIVNEISLKMDEADGLIIGSPVYFASASGTLLSLLDRLFYSTLHKNWMMKVGASVAVVVVQLPQWMYSTNTSSRLICQSFLRNTGVSLTAHLPVRFFRMKKVCRPCDNSG